MRIKWSLCLIGTAILGALLLCQMEYGKKYHDMQNPNTIETSFENAGAHEEGEDMIYFSLLDGTTLQIDKDRCKDSYYGINRLDNRWELDEIDMILNSVQGRWKVDEYMGFVAPTIYFPDLWDHNDNIGDDIRNSLYALYEEKTQNAASNIPEISLSINEKDDGKAVEQNYIYSQSKYFYASPVSIILSLNRMDENYPAFADATVYID